ncbi:hypothetical protein GCM10022255_088890 [Dactylosporangium darangshiense]|uniref:WYL domain-containing protein n=2 Tax=Dactylosporangium darangshiense TaxID=579108 RepID=A0ABP8DNL8_9ACTN
MGLEEYVGAPELTGEVIYQPGWYLLAVPPEAHARLLTLLDPLGARHKPAGLPRASVTRNEAPNQSQEDSSTAFGGERVTVRYSTTVRDENGLRFRIDCHSERLCEIREHFGLVTLKRDNGWHPVNFHITYSRWGELQLEARRPRQ